MANVDNAHGFNFYKRLGPGAGVPIVRVIGASGADFAIGDCVTLASGYANVSSAGDHVIFGVAQEAVTAAASVRKSVAVIPALPDIIFEAQCDSGVAITVMAGRMLLAGTTGVQELDSTGAGALTNSIAPFRVIGIKPGEAWSSHADLLVTIVGSQFSNSVVASSTAG